MERFFPGMFTAMAAALESARVPANFPQGQELSDDIKASGTKAFLPVPEMCASLGFKASEASANKILTLFSREGCTAGEQSALAKELLDRVVDEMHGECFFFLTMSEAACYNHWESGWEPILERFPDTTRDVEEMNKCFAFARYTASMFHTLHVAEWGAICLGNCIGVTDPKKGWGPTEKRLREIIRTGHFSLPASVPCSFEFLEQMHREIDSMVLAWRHKVDHAANHLAIVPNTDFTPDIAKHIIGAVRIFMHRLVEGIPSTQP